MRFLAVASFCAAFLCVSKAEAAPVLTIDDLPLGNFKEFLLEARRQRNGETERIKREADGMVPTCNMGLRCLNTFLSSVGLPNPLPSNPQTYVNALNAYFLQNGASGFLSFCRAYGQLQSCYNGQFSACLTNVVNLVNVANLQPYAAVAYASIFASEQWSCSAGLSVISNNYQCLGNVMTASNASLAQCESQLNQQVQANPDKACNYYQSFLACYTAPFHIGCGVSVGYSICESIRVGFLAATPGCGNLRCPTVTQ